MERHYCYSCRETHAFLDVDEWAIIGPLVQQAQTLSARYGRIGERIGHPPDFPDPWQAAFDSHEQLTGERVTNGATLFHRQLIHVCKWEPRVDDPPPGQATGDGAA